MKKVAVILAVVTVVSMASVSSADVGYISTLAGVPTQVITRGMNSDTNAGDMQGWRGTYNNSKDAGYGGRSNGQGWGTGLANAGLLAFDRAELQAQVDAKGANFTSQLWIVLDAGLPTSYNMVVGLFKADAMGWAATIPGSDAPWNNTSLVNNFKMNDTGAAWASGGVNYNNFEAMVAATGVQYQGLTTTVQNMKIGTAADGTGGITNRQVLKVTIPSSLVSSYLSDTSWTGFFWSNTMTTGDVNSDGGTQWSGGIGAQSLAITPEPATMVLLALGGLTLIRRRNA